MSSISLTKRYNKNLLTPPKKGAIIRKEPIYEKRNEAIKIFAGLGNDRVARSIWTKLSGYNYRVIVESTMARWKKLCGGDLESRCETRKAVEVHLKSQMMNAMVGTQTG